MNKMPQCLFADGAIEANGRLTTAIDPFPSFSFPGGGGVTETVFAQNGDFFKDAGGAPDVITGLGFTPKALILYTTGTFADEWAGALLQSIGVVTPVSQHNVRFLERNLFPTECRSATSSGNAIVRYSGTGILFEGNAVLDADGFTVTWTNASAPGTKISYCALGGDGVDFEAGVFNQPVSPGIQSVPSSLADADAAMFFTTGGTALGVETTHVKFASGAAVKNGNKDFSFSISSESGVATSVTRRLMSESSCIQVISGDGLSIESRANFNGFTPSGFDLDWVTTSGVASPTIYLAIKGGQWDTFRIDTTSIAGPHNTVETLPFEPAFMTAQSISYPAGPNFDQIFNTARYSFSTSTKGNIFDGVTWSDRHNSNTSNNGAVAIVSTQRYADLNNIYFGFAPTTDVQASIAGLIEDDGTLNLIWTVSDGIQRPVYLLIGA